MCIRDSLETVQTILPLLEKEQLSPEQTMQLARLNILEAESRQTGVSGRQRRLVL